MTGLVIRPEFVDAKVAVTCVGGGPNRISISGYDVDPEILSGYFAKNPDTNEVIFVKGESSPHIGADGELTQLSPGKNFGVISLTPGRGELDEGCCHIISRYPKLTWQTGMEYLQWLTLGFSTSESVMGKFSTVQRQLIDDIQPVHKVKIVLGMDGAQLLSPKISAQTRRGLQQVAGHGPAFSLAGGMR